MNAAALSYVMLRSGKILSVWNRANGGWGLPGGKVEPGESIYDAQARELKEETSLETMLVSRPVFVAPSSSGSGRIVHVFLVRAIGDARQMESDSKLALLTRDELIEMSPFASFYRDMFPFIDDWIRRMAYECRMAYESFR